MTEPLLAVRDLRTEFPSREGAITCVDGISFDLKAGETLGIVGESGAGKSMTALSIMRLVQRPGRVVGGEVLFRGRDLAGVSEREMQRIRGEEIAMIFQDPLTSLNPVFKVGWQVGEPLRIHRGMKRAEALGQAITMLGRAGIPQPERRVQDFPHQLSGGMRQRAMIAMGLTTTPAVLIADEPTTALDVTIQAQILDLLRTLSREFGTSTILISHNLGVVAGMCDRVLVMYGGRVVESGRTEEVFGHPTHPYTRGLLRSIPRLDAEEREPLNAIEGAPPDLTRLPAGCAFHPRCRFRVETCMMEVPVLTPINQTQEAACWVTQGGAELDG